MRYIQREYAKWSTCSGGEKADGRGDSCGAHFLIN